MLAIIPARGGSKGIPGKNIKPLCGKPLIVYTIEAALASNLVDRIIVSTDDNQIAEIASKYNIEIPFMRPKELAQDDSKAIDNYLYTIEKLNAKSNDQLAEFVVLLPTSPLRVAEDIDSAIELFKEKNADSVISCFEMLHPPLWAKKISEEGKIRNYFDVDADMLNKNRQELKPAYTPNGAVYVFKYHLLKDEYSYYSEKTYAYIMDQERSADIDSIFDFNYVEYLMSKRCISG